mgnify:CR=1 FL=1
MIRPCARSGRGRGRCSRELPLEEFEQALRELDLDTKALEVERSIIQSKARLDYAQRAIERSSKLREKGVEMITGAVVSRIFADGAEILLNGEARELHGYDHVINAMGAESVNGLAPFAEKYAGETYVIGDAQQPRQALQAISEGYETGNKI